MDKIGDLYRAHLVQKWIPTTLMLIRQKKNSTLDLDKSMGLPRAHDVNDTAAPIITTLVAHISTPILAKLYAEQEDHLYTTVLIPLEEHLVTLLNIYLKSLQKDLFYVCSSTDKHICSELCTEHNVDKEKQTVPIEAIIGKLKEQIRVMEKGETHLEQCIRKCHMDAVAKLKKKNKRGVMLGLKRKRLLEKLLEQKQAQELDLENQLFALENAKISMSALRNIMYVSFILSFHFFYFFCRTRKTHSLTHSLSSITLIPPLSPSLSRGGIDGIDGIEELNDKSVMDMANEISDIMGQQMGDEFDEDELDAELEDSEAEVMAEDMSHIQWDHNNSSDEMCLWMTDVLPTRHQRFIESVAPEISNACQAILAVPTEQIFLRLKNDSSNVKIGRFPAFAHRVIEMLKSRVNDDNIEQFKIKAVEKFSRCMDLLVLPKFDLKTKRMAIMFPGSSKSIVAMFMIVMIQEVKKIPTESLTSEETLQIASCIEDWKEECANDRRDVLARLNDLTVLEEKITGIMKTEAEIAEFEEKIIEMEIESRSFEDELEEEILEAFEDELEEDEEIKLIFEEMEEDLKVTEEMEEEDEEKKQMSLTEAESKALDEEIKALDEAQKEDNLKVEILEATACRALQNLNLGMSCKEALHALHASTKVSSLGFSYIKFLFPSFLQKMT